MKNQTIFKFNGEVVFITGASSGIGRATALLFGKSEAKVMIADTNFDLGMQTANLINIAGGNADFIKCDVSKEEDVKLAIEKTVKTFGRLDFAFNNAGIEGQQATCAESTRENWDQVIQVNLSGVWNCMKYELQELLKTGKGSIVNCSSIAGQVGFPGISAYVASKHGVIGLTKTAALEYAKSNIRVNAVCPGVIQTPMIDRFTHGEAKILKTFTDGEPVGRLGTPEEIAESVLWLCSDSSSFVTGHSLIVDGGWIAQ
jgi:NAD(P)-dependent dehydrogenase (short-subunit alcohol dehydrogenase family)